MDDPWGSPWATTDAKEDPKPPSPAKSSQSGLEPPPRAFFSASGSPRIPAISGQSPWAEDDDGFGDWAAPDNAELAPSSGWGGGWAAPSPKLAIASRDNDFGSATPIAWPGSIAIPKTASASNLRQPSPDPWSADFSPSIDGVSTPRLVVDLPPSPEDIKVPDATDGPGLEWSLKDESRKVENDNADALTPVSARRTGQQEAKEDGESFGASHHDNVQPGVEPADRDHDSPLSSPSGDDTDREDGRQDSPITSIDEESRTRHLVTRKISGKVQELVVKFDGLARAASEEPPIARSDRSRSPLRADCDITHDNNAEFGDFEDGYHQEPPEAPITERPHTPERFAPPEQPTTPKPAQHSCESEASSATPSPQSARSISTAFKRSVPVAFDVDLSIADQIFEKLSQHHTAEIGVVSEDIPDHVVVSDNFTEISERKTWYRVSRMGSSRKYNAGDDENYRLVTWPASTVREDTLKIVRRWMEEDSIAGRVTLGGGVSKTQKNMFGWDSSAEPVALDAVFGRKKHTRGASVHSLHDNQRKPSGTSYRPSSVIVPPVATFGWSSSSPTLPKTQSPGVLPPPSEPPTMPLSSVVPPPSKPATVQKPTFLPAPIAPIQQPAPQDDDDDWGEMVSSPSELKPTENGLLNLDDAFSMPAPNSVSAPQTAADASAFTSNDSVAPPPPADPWAVADLSIFESPPKAPPKPTPAPNFSTIIPTPSAAPPHPPARNSRFEPSPPAPAPGLRPPVSATTKPGTVDHAFSPTTPLEIASPITLPSADDAPKADDPVRRIIANLPDLSYMLR
ncbi:hypothetical protein B0T16DRAFT_490784 [Cercophora newfieldiana]|uniref:Uncharacterized protein n=1 Tax=Cercophora newfieldiana TaxID=92897 RepID=A0AA39YK79_9PEZI|nr:hypothetical protein B0T16DRAFT_490784 [Cercophora newfieldiana]